jgi:hypothetical protein
LDNAHNLPLHLAVTLGVPLSILICTTVLWFFLRAKPWRERNAARQMAWSVLAVIGVRSLLEFPLWYGPFQIAAVCAVWMLRKKKASPFDAMTQGKGLSLSSNRLALCSLATAGVLAAACSYALWDYWRISQIYKPAGQCAALYRENTLNKVRDSWLFQRQVQFAELYITPLKADNAQHINGLAKELLHYSPEPRVVRKVIHSALLLGRQDEAEYYSKRFKAAFPQEYASWELRCAALCLAGTPIGEK